MECLHRVQAVVILTDAGNRIFAKYYTGEDAPASSKVLAPVDRQLALERAIHKTVRDPMRGMSMGYDGDIAMIDGHSVLYRFGDDVTFIVIGDSEENELVLHSVLKTFVDALSTVLSSTDLSTRLLLENYDAVLLTTDEMLDGGIILETNAATIATEVHPYLVDDNTEAAMKALSTVNRYLRENL